MEKNMLDELKKIDWNEYHNDMIFNGLDILNRITTSGYEAFIVGGAARDIAMKDANIHDIDIATNMPMNIIKELFNSYEYGGGERHGTLIIHFNGFDYELTQFRTEFGYSDNRRPDNVSFVSSFEEDSKRRDFTINAMGIDKTGAFLDYHGGISDINNNVIRTVGNPTERFTEDSLRLLRAIRFAVKFNFRIDKNTFFAIEKLANTIVNVSVERIKDEFNKMMSCGNDKFYAFVLLLKKTGLWNAIFPSVELSNDTIFTLKLLNSSDFAMNFAVIFKDLNRFERIELCKKFTFTNEELKTLNYIIDNIDNYKNLSTINKQIGLKVILNSDFEKLRSVYIGINEKDIENADLLIIDIKKYKSILNRQKFINSAISNAGIQGKMFGILNRKIMDWLFSMFSLKKVPTDDEIITFIAGEINS